MAAEEVMEGKVELRNLYANAKNSIKLFFFVNDALDKNALSCE